LLWIKVYNEGPHWTFFYEMFFCFFVFFLLMKEFGCMVFNATFNNVSAISWWSVLLVEETGVPRENHWPAASHWQTLSHNVVSSTPTLTLRYQLFLLYDIYLEPVEQDLWHGSIESTIHGYILCILVTQQRSSLK
jgi:hypothetical protein